MNAGLLGEHLASPRTATKTHQSTALDTPAASSGDPSDQNGFATFVARDAEPSDAAAANRDAETPPTPNPETATESALAALSVEAEAPTATRSLDIDLETAKTETASPVSAPAAAELDAPTATLDTDSVTAPAREVGNSARIEDTAEGDVLTREPRLQANDDGIVAPNAEARAVKPSEGADQLITQVSTQAGDDADPKLAIEPDARAKTDLTRAEADLPRASAAPAASDIAATAQSETRQALSSDATSLDRTGLGGVPREIPVAAAEPVITIGPATTVSTTATVTTGLTPTAPSIPLATPNEITGIILNAINNGIDPQEQLVVQLDPPELGRVMIDFKFDAQGLQQVVVTTENPEALKRMRELHFELTQALREHGLSEQNMSFRQQAEGQSQDAWSSSDPDGREMQLTAAEERRASLSATPPAPRVQPRDRLDLLL
ncbi:MAG: flagellar hook-length control protein FliK [Pseudomonadota bacterium]